MLPRSTRLALGAALLLLAAPAATRAADQTVLGRTLAVKNPHAGADPRQRTVAAIAREIQSPERIVGNPTLPGSAGGAFVAFELHGGTPSSQVFALPQGTSHTGTPFWTAIGGTGFRYRDPHGEQGPVRSVTIKKSPSNVFFILVAASGDRGGLDVVPPNPGTDAYLTLALAGGDRYCVAYGAEGLVANNGVDGFKVRKPQIQACAP